MKAWYWAASGYKEHAGCVTERHQDATGSRGHHVDVASDQYYIQNSSLYQVGPVRQMHRIRNKVFADEALVVIA